MGGERHDAWLAWEWDVLKQLVNESDWLDEACQLLPRRSRNAIAQKMCALRQEAGIVPRPGPAARAGRIDRNMKAKAASEKLRKALEAV